MEYIHVSNITGPTERGSFVTLKDQVIEYKGRQILVQTNELDMFGSKVRYVVVAELLEPLYASSDNNSFSLTRARKIESPEDRKVLTDKIREMGIQEPTNL